MAKKVLIIDTSLRVGSNSDILAESFADGAKAAGKVFAGGVNDAGAIKGHKALAEACEMGRNV